MHSILLGALALTLLQLQNALTFGRVAATTATAQRAESSSAKSKVSTTDESEPRVRRSFEDDFLINQLSREYDDIMTSNLLDSAVTCNNWSDLESDTLASDSFGSQQLLLDPRCSWLLQRSRRAKFDFPRDDLFVPVRGRRDGPDTPRISAEKKAKLDVLINDLFVPNRGKRQLVRKHFLLLDPFAPPDKRSSGNLELDMKDYFVPHRGKRQRTKIDELLSENFLPQRGKKTPSPLMTIIPKSHRALVEYDTLDPWLFQNINSDDRRMIDRLHDGGSSGSGGSGEANKDITAAAAVVATARGEKLIPQIYYDEVKRSGASTPILNSGGSSVDEFASDDSVANLILPSTPLIGRPGFASTTFA